MNDPTIHFPKPFFTSDRLAVFWSYVKYFLSYNMKLTMICLAIILVGLVAGIIVDISVRAKTEYDRAGEDDDYY